MDTVKKPEMLLAASNTVALVGIAIYFYKQWTILRKEVEDLSDKLKACTKRVDDLQKGLPASIQMMEATKQLQNAFQDVEKTKEWTETSLSTCMDDLDHLDETMEAVLEALQKAEVPIHIPRKHRKGKKDGRKRGKTTKRRRRPRKEESSEAESKSSEDDSSDDLASQIATVRKQRKRK